MSIVKDAIREETRVLIKKTIDLRIKRDNTKLEHGKKLFTKKIIKNNKKIAEMLDALTRIEDNNNEIATE